jgi:signal transduction histidine kinase
MALGQSSFRRILLSRLLLLSVPVLLFGVYITYRKARSAFLETARQNLTESAVRKGESIQQGIESLRTNLANASESVVLRSPYSDQRQEFVNQLVEMLPDNVLCAQITEIATNKIVATTCGEAANLDLTSWHKTRDRERLIAQNIEIKLIQPPASILQDVRNGDESLFQSQLKLWLTAPVYDDQGRLRYALSIKSALLSQERLEPGSLEGYPVVIDGDGTILAHPLIQRVGRNIDQMPDARRLGSILDNAISNKPDLLHLFYLETDGVELVAGYSVIPSPVTGQKHSDKWMVLAVTPIDAALLPLKAIRQALVGMTIGLIAASFIVTLYVSREMARPLEQIRDYAMKEQDFHRGDRLPENFSIREFQQLSLALNDMVERLRAWGEEIVAAWKEAKNANQLKSEFLATTSHELRTPLNGIINCIQIVKHGYCENRDEEIEFLQRADDAAIHLLGIINDVLDISKIEAGKLSVVIEKVNLHQILNEAIELHLAAIQQKNLELITSIEEPTIYVNADPAKLKQVFINVLSNAVKFTDTGSIAINIEIPSPDNEFFTTAVNFEIDYRTFTPKSTYDLAVETQPLEDFFPLPSSSNFNLGDHNAPQVILTFQDTGIGIDRTQQDKLFSPFVMVDGSTTRKFGGTGLGLAISRSLLKLMQGGIALYSAGEGKGTTVIMSLPLSKLADES